MLEKLKNSGKLPIVIGAGIALAAIVIIIVAVIIGVNIHKSKEAANANTNVSDTMNQESAEGNQEDEEPIIIDQEPEEELEEQPEEQPKEETPKVDPKYFIRVNYGANVVTIYTKDSNGKYTVPYKAMVCSTGTATPRSGTYEMPSGTYSRGTWGMMIGNVWAQYYTRIKGSILFHSVPYTARNKWSLEYWEYDKLGTSASAGCVRLTVENAKWIYDNCPSGTKVEFYSSSNPGPLQPAQPDKISEHESVRGWDPTDPDKNNPWKTYTPPQKEEIQEEDETTTTPTTPEDSTTPSTPTTPVEKPENNPTDETTKPEEDDTLGEETQNPDDKEEAPEEDTTNPDEKDESEEETTTPTEPETSTTPEETLDTDMGDETTDNIVKEVKVSDITLNKETITTTIGKTETLIPTITPNNATNKKIIWTTSNSEIASVNSNGVVTAKGEGNATITAKTEDGGYTSSCDIKVSYPKLVIDGGIAFTAKVTNNYAVSGIEVEATASGGTGNYVSYSIKLFYNGTLIGESSTDYLFVNQSKNGTYSVTITVVDSNGTTATKTETITKS